MVVFDSVILIGRETMCVALRNCDHLDFTSADRVTAVQWGVARRCHRASAAINWSASMRLPLAQSRGHWLRKRGATPGRGTRASVGLSVFLGFVLGLDPLSRMVNIAFPL